jgi:hypothetical protein
MFVKRKWTILTGVGVVLVTILLMIIFSENHPSTIQLVFLDYTNAADGAEAVFSVRFPSKFGGCGWRQPVVSRKEGLAWKNWSATKPPFPRMRCFTGAITRSADGGEGMAKAFSAFSVETTNEVSRIVIQVDENPRRWSRIEGALRQVWAWISMNPGARAGATRNSYFITNETTIKPAT